MCEAVLTFNRIQKTTGSELPEPDVGDSNDASEGSDTKEETEDETGGTESDEKSNSNSDSQDDSKADDGQSADNNTDDSNQGSVCFLANFEMTLTAKSQKMRMTRGASTR